MLKFIHLLPATMLVCFALLQLNDPDPVFWTSLYLLAALAPLMHALNKPSRLYRGLVLGAAIGFGLAGLTLVLEGATVYLDHMGDESLIQDMSPEKPYIEDMRELLGTSIALGIVGVYCLLNHRKQ